MKQMIVLLFTVLTIPVFSQCEIKNRVAPDKTMSYYIEPVNFYWTKATSLKGGIVTDRENYFLELLPIPFPLKPAGKKLNKDLEIKLSNNKIYELSHYDTRYIDNDTVMQMLYLITKKELEDFLNFEVIEARINMMGKEGIRTYVFKLHKSALKEQLACFLKEEADKKKK
jgi:hypothetical protein